MLFRSGEELAAVFAAVAGLPGVALPVQVEQADLAVTFPTRGTAVRFQRAARRAQKGQKREV